MKTDCTPIPWKPFPYELLPEPAGVFIDAGARAIGCDPALVGVPLLAALASAIGATRRIELKPGWTEPSVLWTGIVSESGTLKSPAQSLALDPLRRLQAWAMQEYPELVEQYNRDKVLYEADLGDWKRKGRSAGEPPPEKPEEPVVRRYLVNDVTIEALAHRLQHAPRGLLCDCDELASWLRSFDLYRSGRGGDVARWLSIHRAESLLVDRKTGATKTIFVPRAAVSITGGIQPGALARALGTEHWESGLAARLLLASPPRRRKQWSEATVDPQLVRRIEVLFGRLLALDFGTDDNDSPTPIDLPLTPEGKQAWAAFYDEHADRQLQAAGEEAALLAKIEGAAARLALVTHLVQQMHGDGTSTTAGAVDQVSTEAGVALARRFAHEGRRVYLTLAETDEERQRRELTELIERKGGCITVRGLQRCTRRFADSAEAAEEPLGELAKAGIGHWVAVPPTRKGGQPKRIFRLSTPLTVDTTPTKPEENVGCVNVDTVDMAKINRMLAADDEGDEADHSGGEGKD